MTKLLLILTLFVLSVTKSSKGLLSPFVKPISYDLSLELSEQLNKTSFNALANITLIFNDENHRSIVLNSKNLKFKSNWRVFRQGLINIPHNLLEENVKLETVNFPVSKAFDVGVSYSLVVEYEGVVNDEKKQGLFMNRYKNVEGEHEIMLMTQMAPIYLRTLIPCIDEPQFPAVFQLRVHNVPDGYGVISNGLYSTSNISETNGYEVLNLY